MLTPVYVEKNMDKTLLDAPQNTTMQSGEEALGMGAAAGWAWGASMGVDRRGRFVDDGPGRLLALCLWLHFRLVCRSRHRLTFYGRGHDGNGPRREQLLERGQRLTRR